MSDAILLVVRTQQQADQIQQFIDPTVMYVIGAAGSLTGNRFSSIINTVSEKDFASESERENFKRWCIETLPCRLLPGGTLLHK